MAEPESTVPPVRNMLYLVSNHRPGDGSMTRQEFTTFIEGTALRGALGGAVGYCQQARAPIVRGAHR